MKKLLLCSLFAFTFSTFAMAQNAYFEVQTDKESYTLGETVTYQIFTWASSGDNAGIALASGNVYDSFGETLSSVSFDGNYYSTANGFYVKTAGTWSAAEEKLLSMGAGQMSGSQQYNMGNDDIAHLLATGSYIPSIEGDHTLSIEIGDNMATYWATDSSTASTAFSVSNITITGANFSVIPEPAMLSLLAIGLVGASLRKRKTAAK